MPSIRLLTLVAIAFLVAGAGRKPPFHVRFHVEAKGNAGGSFTLPAKFVNPPREGFIESVPFASERNIIGIYPVQNPDGSLGCAFQLNQSGALGLRTLSMDRRGASVVGFISTKAGTHQLIDLSIDRPVTDGIIYFPRGFSPGEIGELQNRFPLMKGAQEIDTPNTVKKKKKKKL